MYKECLTTHAIERQRALEKGFQEILLTKSYDDLSVSDFCSALNIPRKAFYRYFSNKEGALFALIDHSLEDAIDEFLAIGDHAETIEEVMARLFSYWHRNKSLLDALANNHLSGILLKRAIDYVLNNTEFANAFFPVTRFNPAQNYTMIFIVSGIVSLIIQWHDNGFDKSPEEMGRIAAGFLPYRPLF